MRVAILSTSAEPANAIGCLVAHRVRFFLERGAEVRVFVGAVSRVHPAIVDHVHHLREARLDGDAWAYLASCDLAIFEYTQDDVSLEFLPLLAARTPRPRIVVDYQGISPPEGWPAGVRESLEKGLANRPLLWCADHVVTHSQHIADEAASFDIPRERIEHIDHFVLSQPRTTGDRDWLSARTGAPAERWMLFVGRVAINKNVGVAIEALARLRTGDLLDVRLAVVGDTADHYQHEARRLGTLARSLGVGERVHFLGKVSDDGLWRAYQSADVLVMPSKHEGFCIPVVEAFAAGLPVVAARATALPETLGEAGFTFDPDDADDLANLLRRLFGDSPRVRPNRPRRIAIVVFRFGANIVGGAEASLRTAALALHRAGCHVEVLTTCTTRESDWRDDVQPGAVADEGVPVHRCRVDSHHADVFHENVRQIVQADGAVDQSTEEAYLRGSIHSSSLVNELARRIDEFDAILVGPYLFGLTADIARTFPEKAIVVPCFHNEPIARLRIWPRLYGRVAGLLFHSPEEQTLAQTRFGVNHPNVAEMGTCLPAAAIVEPASRSSERPFLVYAGRFSAQKNVPLLLEWMERYQRHRPGAVDLAVIGRGETPIAQTPWLRMLGRVDEETKRSLLGQALGLVQLSTQESLSIVAIEAWAVKTPVIVHDQCDVLRGQVLRSGGGEAVGDFEAFRQAVDKLLDQPELREEQGRRGRAYVEARYGNESEYVARILACVDNVARPVREVMIEHGRRRSDRFSVATWEKSHEAMVERWMERPLAVRRLDVLLEPVAGELVVGPNDASVFLPILATNLGDVPIEAAGVGRWRFEATTIVDGCEPSVNESPLSDRVAVGGSTMLGAMANVPTEASRVIVEINLYQPATDVRVGRACVTVERGGVSKSPLSGLLSEARRRAGEAMKRAELPDDYADVTEGRWAPWKRWIKRKLLNNFKRGYVDVLSRQQSSVNESVATALQELSTYCAGLEQTVQALHARLDELERRHGTNVGRDAKTHDEAAT